MQKSIEDEGGRILEVYCLNLVLHALTPNEVVLHCLLDDSDDSKKQRRENLFNPHVTKLACFHSPNHHECQTVTSIVFVQEYYNTKYGQQHPLNKMADQLLREDQDELD